MASNINFSSIDETFPIAGKDNDSQGFRDNFQFIKNSLEAAKSEVEDLQNNTAKTNATSNFNFQQVQKAKFVNCGEVVNTVNQIDTSTGTIDYSAGSVAIVAVSVSTTITFTNFPPIATPATAARIRVHLTSTVSGESHDITFAVNAGTIKKNGSINPVTVNSSTAHKVVDFWTYDGGATLFMDLVGTFS